MSHTHGALSLVENEPTNSKKKIAIWGVAVLLPGFAIIW